MKRAGTQPFQGVADMLRTLDRPEAFLQQARPPPAVKRAYPLAIEHAAENPDEQASWTPPETIQDLRALVQETAQELVPSNASLSTSQPASSRASTS